MGVIRYRYLKRWVVDLYKTAKLYKYYNFTPSGSSDMEKAIVLMVDGRLHHGGLSDRFSGIISAFRYSQLCGVDFKIYWIYPFRLEDYLEPNEYDWRIKADDLCYNIWKSRPCYISVYSFDPEVQLCYATKRLRNITLQTHLYTNMQYYRPIEFGACFNKLFKMTKSLEEEILKNLTVIGGKYISITFRFQQLLGDFKETGFPVLQGDDEKRNLIEHCLDHIKILHEQFDCRILVTSDSQTFLNEANTLFPYVYTIKGNVLHMDYVGKEDHADKKTHLKSFVDFFMIAKATHIYLVYFKPLYLSFFPRMASYVYGRPFDIIS